MLSQICEDRVIISIHALREEGDQSSAKKPANSLNFYPRPPRGGRRLQTIWVCLPKSFLSTPSARRATRQQGKKRHSSQFLSTPSARRATWPPSSAARLRSISIHALREEGDSRRAWSWWCPSYFYPRPPRGGRPRRRRPACRHTPISIHALREEGDATEAAEAKE